MAYAFLSDLKIYLLTNDITVTGDDILLQQCLDRAQAITDQKCNRRFEALADTTRNLDAPLYFEPIDYEHMEELRNDFWLLTVDEDLCQITTVLNGDGTTITSSQYVTEPRNRTPYYGIRLKWSAGVAWTWNTSPESAIAITGRWAYSLTAPDDITQATVRLAAWLYRQKDTSKDNSADRPIMSASGTVIMPSSLPRDYMEMITPYIRAGGTFK